MRFFFKKHKMSDSGKYIKNELKTHLPFEAKAKKKTHRSNKQFFFSLFV